ncbi:c-type cytochrome [Adhaeribacter pallidiroseus]|uniref:Cytochrome c domain-containing protein n=1 Tax=Adhaeribacter pallidiroseus TaxID=2072847 RepID=A0A369QHF2_9BACT|nr:cytochrome c [Adhaeribacter pallidiroseus]RDC62646.1 hypothetical protein AHMF7616_01240 [Adhaeribacter pallidiroseus]
MSKVKKISRWLGIILGVLLLLILVGYGFIYLSTEQRMNRKYSFSEPALIIPTDSVAIVKGKHLYQIRSCADCHGPNLAGGVFMNSALLMQLSAPNLTKGPGGLPPDFTTQDWLRVLRHGVDKNGRSLWMMPAHESTGLSQEDMASLIAYCQSVPPVVSAGKKRRQMGPLGRVVLQLNQVAVLPAERINHQVPMAASAPKDVTAYGQYLATVCQGCHRPNMKGGAPLAPGFPPVPDISATGVQQQWSEAQFISTIRQGKTPAGKLLRQEFMPWQNMQHFTDEELSAIRSYLVSLK